VKEHGLVQVFCFGKELFSVQMFCLLQKLRAVAFGYVCACARAYVSECTRVDWFFWWAGGLVGGCMGTLVGVLVGGWLDEWLGGWVGGRVGGCTGVRALFDSV